MQSPKNKMTLRYWLIFKMYLKKLSLILLMHECACNYKFEQVNAAPIQAK